MLADIVLYHMQAKIVTEQNAREPQVPAPHITTVGGGGEQKDDADKLVVCIGGALRGECSEQSGHGQARNCELSRGEGT